MTESAAFWPGYVGKVFALDAKVAPTHRDLYLLPHGVILRTFASHCLSLVEPWRHTTCRICVRGFGLLWLAAREGGIRNADDGMYWFS